MVTLTYVGPHAEGVDVKLPNGRTVSVEHGGTADFSEQIAESLLEQGPDHWQAAKAAKKTVVADGNKADDKTDDTAEEVN